MTHTTFEQIELCLPPEDFLGWLRGGQHSSPEAAWAVCPRGDWMEWMLRASHTRLRLVRRPASAVPLLLAACDCAEIAANIAHHKKVVRETIDTARAWARQEASQEDVQSAADASEKAFWRAHWASERWAGPYSATMAIRAAHTAACYAALQTRVSELTVASSVSVAAYAHAAGGDLGRGAEASKNALAQCADIFRRYYPEVPELPDL